MVPRRAPRSRHRKAPAPSRRSLVATDHCPGFSTINATITITDRPRIIPPRLILAAVARSSGEGPVAPGGGGVEVNSMIRRVAGLWTKY